MTALSSDGRNRRVQKLLKITRQRGADVKARTVRHFGNDQARGVQEQAAKLHGFAEAAIQGKVAVLVVAQDGVSR